VSLIGHGIVRTPSTVGGAGLRGEPLIVCSAAGLWLWATDADESWTLGRPDALEHHAIVERICALGPCLPLRFGTLFARREGAEAVLVARANALREALDRVAGKTELALTLVWREAAPVPAPGGGGGPGRRFLEQRRDAQVVRDQRRARASELSDRLVAELSLDPALVWHEICTSEAVAVSLAVLTPTERALERKADLARVASGFPDVSAVVSGPWPPYSFSALDPARPVEVV
jgi:hypothetical protein